LLALGSLMTTSGPFPWCLELVSRALENQNETSAARARILALKARLEGLSGQIERGLETLAEAGDVVSEEDAHARAEVEMAHGFLLWRKGDAASAESYYARAEQFAHAAGEDVMRAHSIATRTILRSAMGKHEDSVERMQLAHELSRPDLGTHADITYLAGWMHCELGEHAEAQAYLELAAANLRQLRRLRPLAATYAALGWLELDRMAPDVAERHFNDSLVLARETAHPRAEVAAYIGLALARILRGEFQSAETTLERALAIPEALANARSAVCLLAYRAYAAARQERHVHAGRWMAQAQERARTIGGTLAAEVDLIFEAVALASGAPLSAASRKRQIQPGDVLGERLSLRLLEAVTRASHDAELPERPAADALVVDSGGRWFERPGQPRVTLERSAALASLLSALVDAQLDSTDRLLTLDECFAALAQGESASVESKANRVYVAISRLRKLGLRNAIVGSRRGYRLSSALRVVVAGR
jgi:tetratricopeptide (TPR) repeat protein